MPYFRRVAVSFIALVLLVGIAAPAHAALTEPQIQAIIGLLSSFGADSSTISNVNASLRGQAPVTPGGGTNQNDNEGIGSTVSSCATLTRTLSKGHNDIGTNGEVSQLQGFLTDYFNLGDAITSGYYGVLTEKYVKQFQAQNGIEQVGYLGQKTRAAIARVCGSISVQTITVPPKASIINVDVDGNYILSIGYYNLPSSELFIKSRDTASVAEFLGRVEGNSGIEVNARKYSDGYYYVVAQRVVSESQTPVEVARSPMFYIGSTPITSGTPSCTITASPSVVSVGQNVNLSWTSTNAVDAEYVQDSIAKILGLRVGEMKPNGSDSVLISNGKNPSYTVTLRVDGVNASNNTCQTTFQVSQSSYSGITVTAPNAAAYYYYGQPLTVSWSSTRSFPTGSTACVTLRTENSGVGFAFPAQGGSCVGVAGIEPLRSVTGTIMRNAGYDLAPGAYRAVVRVSGPPTTDGRDGALLATDESDMYFKILDSTTSGGITVTAPNGGEQWEIGQQNTITWSPYGYNPDVNPARDVNVFLERPDGSTVAQVLDTGKASMHTYFNIVDYRTFAQPGQYRIYVGNKVTGATDRSDGLFTLLPRGVDIKVNGSDGPVTLTDNQPITVTYNTTGAFTSCTLTGLRGAIGQAPGYASLNLNAAGTVNGYAYAPMPGSSTAISATCYKPDGTSRGDSVQINMSGSTAASLQVVSPNGGEQFNENPETQSQISWEQDGISSVSIALYKNDAWFNWIKKDLPSAPGRELGCTNIGGSRYRCSYTDSLLAGVFAYPASSGKAFKVYITGQKADGTGYVDDKSDAPFSFTSSATSTSTTGTYDFYTSNGGRITTANSTRDAALTNCQQNAATNPTVTVWCTWNGTEIYRRAPTTTQVSATSTVSTSGPKVNKMSCSNSTKTGLTSLELACYGLWDFGNEFGNDQNMCPPSGYSSATTGCTVNTSICQSGRATATRTLDVYAPWHTSSGPALASTADIATIASNLNSTPSAVSSQIIRIWEYTCN